MNAVSAPKRVLVVDDEASISDLVATALRYEGFEVETAGSGRDALSGAESFAPDLIVLDVMLPDFDGFEVHRRLTRDNRAVPTIYLTARDATEDRIRGLTLGGDDYVAKPFSLDELIARVRAVLRRVDGNRNAEGVLAFSDLVLDEDRYEVARSGEAIELTPTEFKLLRYLLLNPGRVLSKSQILDHVWEYDFGGDSNIVETYVSYLRRKVDAGRAPLIRTVRGIGYVLREER